MNMHVESTIEGTALITIEDISADNAPTIYGHNTLSRFVDQVRAAVIGEVPDLTTDKGRKRIASLAATVARSKTAVDGFGRAYLKKLKEMPKVIEGELREFGAEMDAVRDEIRKPLNDFEAAALARKDAIEDAILLITDLFVIVEGATSQDLNKQHSDLLDLELTVETYQERLEEAESKRIYGVQLLGTAYQKQLAIEEQAAELETLRKDKAARDEQDRINEAAAKAVEAERQRLAGERQAELDASAQRVRDAEQQTLAAQQRAEQAESNRIESERRADQARQQSEQRAEQAADNARQQEAQRQIDETAEAARQKQAREDDKAYRGVINKSALDALLNVNMSAEGQQESFLSEVEAKAIITAIVRGMIPAVSVTY